MSPAQTCGTTRRLQRRNSTLTTAPHPLSWVPGTISWPRASASQTQSRSILPTAHCRCCMNWPTGPATLRCLSVDLGYRGSTRAGDKLLRAESAHPL